ncbi:ABC transporter permease (plasmid) [Rhizobium lusitanum]|uniref:ABC transporter permease n=1 Tax=Rhizobium lusitanum TaxID=293958 RepID=UPI001616B417|nr:ABC transporter permease [Rhizobium lusitanum]QND44415.1 ABC transporter permease [Rhizobium lusitanum]
MLELRQQTASDLLRNFLLIAVPAGFALTTDYYLSSGNLFALAQTFSLVGLVALGLSLTMIVGEFDLSVAPMVAVGGLILAKTGESSAFIGVALAVLFGAAVGLLNAHLVFRLKVSSLVTTLGAMILLSGFAFWIAGGQVVPYNNFDAADAVDQKMFYMLSPRILVTLAAFVLAAFVLRFTRLGRDLYATGSHRQSAIMSGARTGHALYFSFCTSGICAALAGALLSISLATGSPTLGNTLLVQAASAAILGGVALGGGTGRPLGIGVGVGVLAALNNGLSLAGANSATTQLVNGAVLAVVVILGGDLGRLIKSRRRILASR